MKKGFTLLELLIVIGILAILATGVVVILNPAELLKQSRDAKRMAELNSLNKALELYSFDGGNNFGSITTVYISLPDTSQTCNSWLSLLPALPTDWSYNCATQDNLRKVDGNGWLPVDFTNTTTFAFLNVLPIDPLNNSDSYYSYTVGSWKLTANLESQKYKDKTSNSQNISFSLCPAKVKDADFESNSIEYPTVLINGQCWMKENLRRGTTIAGNFNQADNGQVERYCYNKNPPYYDDAICATDGGLYQWDEAMNYSTTEGSQGICPIGWHIPTDSEQYDLENYLKDSGQTCDATREGFDCAIAGDKLKLDGLCQGRIPCGYSMIEGLLAGIRDNSGSFFYNRGADAYFWSSTQSGPNAWNRSLYLNNAAVYRNAPTKELGFSVRCLKD